MNLTPQKALIKPANILCMLTEQSSLVKAEKKISSIYLLVFTTQILKTVEINKSSIIDKLRAF